MKEDKHLAELKREAKQFVPGYIVELSSGDPFKTDPNIYFAVVRGVNEAYEVEIVGDSATYAPSILCVLSDEDGNAIGLERN